MCRQLVIVNGTVDMPGENDIALLSSLCSMFVVGSLIFLSIFHQLFQFNGKRNYRKVLIFWWVSHGWISTLYFCYWFSTLEAGEHLFADLEMIHILDGYLARYWRSMTNTKTSIHIVHGLVWAKCNNISGDWVLKVIGFGKLTMRRLMTGCNGKDSWTRTGLPEALFEPLVSLTHKHHRTVQRRPKKKWSTGRLS